MTGAIDDADVIWIFPISLLLQVDFTKARLPMRMRVIPTYDFTIRMDVCEPLTNVGMSHRKEANKTPRSVELSRASFGRSHYQRIWTSSRVVTDSPCQ